MSTREEAKAKVEKLLKITTANGATPSEEQTARKLAEALIVNYGLEDMGHCKTRGYDHWEYSGMSTEDLDAYVEEVIAAFSKVGMKMSELGDVMLKLATVINKAAGKETQPCLIQSTTQNTTPSEESSALRQSRPRSDQKTDSSRTARATS